MSTRIVLSWSRRGPPSFIGGAELASWRLLAFLANAGVETYVVGRMHWPWKPCPSDAKTTSYLWRGVRCIETVSEDERLATTIKLCVEGQNTTLLSALEGSQQTFLNCAHSADTTLHWVHSADQVIGKIRFDGAELYASRYLAKLGDGTEDDVLTPLTGHRSCPTHRFVIPSETCTGLFVNPVPQKGFHTVVAIAEAMPEIKFIVRMGWYDDLQPRTLPGNICVLARSPWNECIYAGVDFVLMPSEAQEGYGLVAAEALVHGLSCLGSRVGSLSETLPSDFIVASNRLSDWCTAIHTITGNPGAARSLAVRAGKQIRHREELSLRRFVERLGLTE